MKYYALIGLLSLALVTYAQASSIIYHGNNPDISPSANPNNEASIAAIAALNKPKNTGPSASNTVSESDLLKQSVVTGLSTSYLQLLTGSGTGSGTVNFGDGSYASYSTAGGIRTVTFYDLTGQTTISFPVN